MLFEPLVNRLLSFRYARFIRFFADGSVRTRTLGLGTVKFRFQFTIRLGFLWDGHGIRIVRGTRHFFIVCRVAVSIVFVNHRIVFIDSGFMFVQCISCRSLPCRDVSIGHLIRFLIRLRCRSFRGFSGVVKRLEF